MVTESQLLKMISDCESYNIEKTKSTKDTEKFCQAICAFANDYPNSGKPGYLLIGVNDDGSLSNLRITDKLNKEIAGLRTDGNILPLPQMSVENFRLPGGDVLLVEVEPSMEPPVKYGGRTWIRNGARKGIATYSEEQRLIEKRQLSNRSFDIKPCYDSSLDDLDLDNVKRYLDKAINREVLAADPRDLKNKMSSLRLYDLAADRPTNAAVILFGNRPVTYLPGAYIQYVQFSGQDNSSEIVDERVFSGGLMKMLPELENFIDTAIIKRRPVKISALQEGVEQNYPEWALRELVMNSIMHRDYSSNTPAKLYQYSDRIDITNPGGLFGNATPSNFPNVNDYRNPIISEALKILGYVNKFNRGIAKVQSDLSANGNGVAVFSLDKETVFEVKIAKAIHSLSEVGNDEVVSNQVSESGVGGSDGSSKDEMALFDSLRESLPSRSMLILGFCVNAELTKKEIFNLLGLTNQTNNVRTNINPLLQSGLLAMTVNNKTSKLQKYSLTGLGRRFLEYLSIANES